jgi:hypothetical protein
MFEAWKRKIGADVEIEPVQQNPEHLDLNVTGCRYADFFRQLGEIELGALLLCEQDFHVTEQITNPEVMLASQNRNWWFNGIVLRYQALSNLASGLEIFHGTSQQVSQSAQTGFNRDGLGLSDLRHIMFSAGPVFGGPNQPPRSRH